MKTNLKEALERGIGIDFSELYKWTTVNIIFEDDYHDDEVQFDVEQLQTNKGQKELEDLFINFLKEEDVDISKVNVLDVVFVRTAGSYEALMHLEAEEEGYCFIDE